MKKPTEEQKAPPDAEPPDFDTLDDPAEIVRGDQTRDRIYVTALQLDEPTRVSDVADRAETSTDSARDYLKWFADMGIVSKIATDPVQFVTNRDYLNWRRADRLSREYREEELVTKLQDVRGELKEYKGRYDAESASEISVSEAADRQERSVAEVWKEISNWKSAEQRHNVLSEALNKARSESFMAANTGSGLSSVDLLETPTDT